MSPTRPTALHRVSGLRRIALPLLRRLARFDIRIRHHWTGDRIWIHPYLHKGYWYHGKRREKETLELSRRLLSRNGTVLDVGAHIGYFSLFFKKTVGDGMVVAFEPGANNLPYIRRNIAGTGIRLVEKAVGDRPGTLEFYLDNLTGQNNSAVKDFAGFESNQAVAFNREARLSATTVECVSLDEFCAAEGLHPDFVKIDVEAFEAAVLRGMTGLLENDRPMVMVEVSANREEILEILNSRGYRCFTPAGRLCLRPDELNGNIFCFHAEKHKAELHRAWSGIPREEAKGTKGSSR